VAILLFLLASGRSTGNVIPLAALYAFAGYRLLPAIQQVYSSAMALRSRRASLQIMMDDMAFQTSAVTDSSSANQRHSSSSVDSHSICHGIHLRNVIYKYPGADDATLKGITLDIPANKTVALVGASGAGKTTVVDIVLGLLSASEGQLLVDDVEVRPDNLPNWQRSIGYVPQAIYLIDDTVRRNIALGVSDDEICEQSVVSAAKAARLHEFIERELPNGYDTVVGDRGIRLSGGQRQRLGIARALYHNPDVVVLDEATSALDGVTEEAVMDAIRGLSGRKTIVIIAHRLSTIMHADVIYLLENGRVADSGTFEELRANSIWFRTAAGAPDATAG
jgi:ABC-type multidrug transport system fused ATPase/permease subunit